MTRRGLLHEVVSRAATVRVRNVLNPILWLCAIAGPLCLGFSALAGIASPLGLASAIVGFAPIVAAIGAYIYFMLKDPNRLHSEEYLIAHQRLTLEAKGTSRVEDAEAVPPAANPELETWDGEHDARR